jgi:hypothetical protein
MLSTPMPARPTTFKVRRGGNDLLGGFGRRANGETIVLTDDLSELFLVLAECRLEGHVDAAILKICTAVEESSSEMRTLGAMAS